MRNSILLFQMRFFRQMCVFFIVCYVYLFDFVWYLQLYDPITNYLVLQQAIQVFQQSGKWWKNQQNNHNLFKRKMIK